MTVIFRAKTSEGYILKILTELLHNNVRTACLKITEEGIQMRMMDSHRFVLIDILLQYANFNIYDLQQPEIFLGINLTHFYKMIKSIKKKDALMLSIDDSQPDILTMTILPRDNNRVVNSTIRIQSIQHINIPLPEGYSSQPINIPSNEYQTTIKDMHNIGDTLTIAIKKYSLNISCSAQGIFSRDVVFGELDDDSEEHYRDNFNMEQFARLSKLSGLSPSIQVYSGNKQCPLLIVAKVGGLGSISIYIKSQEQIRLDNSTKAK